MQNSKDLLDRARNNVSVYPSSVCVCVCVAFFGVKTMESAHVIDVISFSTFTQTKFKFFIHN